MQELAASDVFDVARDKEAEDRKPVFKHVRNTISSGPLWTMLAHTVNCMAPIEESLRLTDSYTPSLCIAYSALMDMRERTASENFQRRDRRHTANKRRLDVICRKDSRIDFIATPVDRAAFALNPRHRAPNFPEEVIRDLQEVLCQTFSVDEGIKVTAVPYWR